MCTKSGEKLPIIINGECIGVSQFTMKIIQSFLVFFTLFYVANANVFSNPISDVNWPDPYAYFHEIDGYYYMPRSEDDGVTLYRTRTLENWRTNESSRIYTAVANLGEVWAPEIHYIDGNFYIYVAMSTDGLNEHHRMYVMQANDSNDPMGTWTNAMRYKRNFVCLTQNR